MKTLILAAALVAGCINGNNPTPDPGHEQVAVTNLTGAVSYLCVGMENSARFGACPGCANDAKGLSGLMADKFGYTGTTLISAQATKAAVVQQLKDAVARTTADDLFLFFYSGHGGQEYLNGQEPAGADAADEYLCLYDAPMIDDEIWSIVSTCRGRVFLYFDACHSATMFRSVSSERRLKASGQDVGQALGVSEKDMVRSGGFKMRMEKLLIGKALSTGGVTPRILCWSGCKEAEYSFGGTSGGVLTLSVLRSWKPGICYGTLWNDAKKKVESMSQGQNPVMTVIGNYGSTGLEAFK